MSEKTTSTKTETTKRKRGGTHPKHPRCPGCSKALRKRAEPGKGGAKKSDPYRWCFNESCPLHGVDQSDEANAATIEAAGKEFKAASTKAAAEKKARKEERDAKRKEQAEARKKFKEEKAEKPAKKPAKKSKAKKPKPAKKPKAKKPKAEPEPEVEAEPETAAAQTEHSAAYIKARKRIKSALKDDGELAKNICDLAVSMVKKADGVEVANALISEFKLTERYDIELLDG